MLELEPGKDWFTGLLLELIEEPGHLLVQQPSLVQHAAKASGESFPIKSCNVVNVLYDAIIVSKAWSIDDHLHKSFILKRPHRPVDKDSYTR